MARPSARTRLLDTAEVLFAEHGLAGVSLRTINAEAGLSPAALHYHFGSQDALVEALLERQMPALMERRRGLLERLAARETPPSVREVLDALVRPLAELLDEQGEAGHRYIRLLYRLEADGDLFSLFPADRYGQGVERLVPLFERALPGLDREVLTYRLGFAIDAMLRSLAMAPNVSGPGSSRHVGWLLDALTGALEAPDQGGR